MIEIDFLCNTFKGLNLDDDDHNRTQAIESEVLDGFAHCQSITSKVPSLLSKGFSSSLEINCQAIFTVFGKFHSVIPIGGVYVDDNGVFDDMNFKLSDEIDGTLQTRYLISPLQYCPSWSHPNSLRIYHVLSDEEDNFGCRFLHVNFIVVLSSAQRQILLDYYFFFLWKCSLIVLVFLWFADEKDYLISLVILFVISWMFSFYENDSSHYINDAVLSIIIILKEVQLQVLDYMKMDCQLFGVMSIHSDINIDGSPRWLVILLSVGLCLHSCGVDKIEELYVGDYGGMGQNQKDDLVPYCTSRVFYNS